MTVIASFTRSYKEAQTWLGIVVLVLVALALTTCDSDPLPTDVPLGPFAGIPSTVHG